MAGRGSKAGEKVPDQRTSIKDILGVAGSTASVASTVILVLSVTYEWAYFYVVGQKFRNIASFTDYLINALDWLPLAIVLGIGYLIFVVVFSMLSGLTDRKNKEASESYVRGLKQARASGQYEQTILWCGFIVIGACGVFGFFVYYSGDPATDLMGIAAAFFFLWLSITSIAVTRSPNPTWLGTAMMAVITIVPPLFVGVFLWGMQHGYADLSAAGEAYKLTRKTSQPQKSEAVKVLRTFERGILVRTAQTTEFVRWDEILTIALERDGQAGKSLACRQQGWGC